VQITIAPEYLGRFSDALVQLGVCEDERVMLAVSGGPDSLALLLLAHQCAAGRITAATIDHQLRSESADEAAYVGTICQQLGIRHVVLTPVRKIAGNIQSSARAARYELLANAADAHGCASIATAHHADDQLETLLMRLMRGSGIDGLASIRTRNGTIFRPLLGFSKLELEEICATAGITPVRDPSNDNPDFDRVAVRQWLAASNHPFQSARITRTVRALGDAAEALNWVADDLSAKHIKHERDVIQCDSANLPHDLKRRLLLRCLSQLEPDLHPRGESIDRLLVALDSGKTSMIGNILCKGGINWTFSVAPARHMDR
jgi:tRNA(Ile)-lysidine synthase